MSLHVRVCVWHKYERAHWIQNQHQKEMKSEILRLLIEWVHAHVYVIYAIVFELRTFTMWICRFLSLNTLLTHSGFFSYFSSFVVLPLFTLRILANYFINETLLPNHRKNNWDGILSVGIMVFQRICHQFIDMIDQEHRVVAETLWRCCRQIITVISS